MCDLRFLPGGRFSLELFREVARVLEAEQPQPVASGPEGTIVHRFTSVDGLWTFVLGPSQATLKTQALREPQEFLGRAFRITDVIHAFLKTVLYKTVRLQFMNAVPVGHVQAPHLFSDWAARLNTNAWERRSEFAQSISGIEQGIQYWLRYAIRPVGQEQFYLSDASVSVKDVEAERVREVLSGLESQGLRLLSLPITEQAMASLRELGRTRSPKPGETFQVSEWMDELWRTSPEFEAIALGANAERLGMLARKHEGQRFSPDDQKRLDDLTQQVRTLMPRTTAADWEYARELKSRIDDIEDHVDRIRQKYGLLG